MLFRSHYIWYSPSWLQYFSWLLLQSVWAASEVVLRHGQMSKIQTNDLRRERKNRDGRSGGWVGKRMSGWGWGWLWASVEERGKKTYRLCHQAATFIVWWHPCCGIVPRRDINSNHQFHHNRQLTQAANIVEPVTSFTLYMRAGQIRGWIYMCPTNHTILKAILQISLRHHRFLLTIDQENHIAFILVNNQFSQYDIWHKSIRLKSQSWRKRGIWPIQIGVDTMMAVRGVVSNSKIIWLIDDHSWWYTRIIWVSEPLIKSSIPIGNSWNGAVMQ